MSGARSCVGEVPRRHPIVVGTRSLGVCWWSTLVAVAAVVDEGAHS